MLSRVFFWSQFLSFDIGQRCSGFYWEATPWVKSSRDPLRSSATLSLSLTDPLPPLFHIHVHLQASGFPSTWSFSLSKLRSEIPSVLSTDRRSHSIELPQPFSLAGHLSGSHRSSIQCLVGKPDNRRKAVWYPCPSSLGPSQLGISTAWPSPSYLCNGVVQFCPSASLG